MDNLSDNKATMDKPMPIEWLVLQTRGNSFLLLSRYILDDHKLDDNKIYRGWGDCELRRWLNNEFLNAAFTTAEQHAIQEISVAAPASVGGNDGLPGEDKIFILSCDEAENYFPEEPARRASRGPYQCSLWSTGSVDGEGNYDWWLRSTDSIARRNNLRVVAVAEEGGLSKHYSANSAGGVRPALWIDMEFLEKHADEIPFVIEDGILKEYVFADGVTEIEGRVFAKCSGLTSIIISDGVRKIGKEIFKGCSGLTSITIPDSVTEIGEKAFALCGGLTSVVISDGLQRIGGFAFEDGVTIDESVLQGHTVLKLKHPTSYKAKSK